jgi:predicted enzyme related to lactoylglutathione lyase
MDLMTSDREGAMRFYGALFGWDFEVGPPETGYYTMCLLQGDPVAGIGEQQPDQPGPVAWTTYLAVDDLDKTCTTVTEHGGKILMPPLDVMDQGRMAIAADPTGAVFGMWQAGKHTGARRVNEPGAMCWNEVVTRDPETAGTFYADVFGYELEKMESGPGFDYTTFKVDGRTVAGMLGMGEDFPADVPPHWHGYFGTADPEEAAGKVRDNGGTVTRGPFDSPYGRIVVIQDPQGAVVSLITVESGTPG